MGSSVRDFPVAVDACSGRVFGQEGGVDGVVFEVGFVDDAGVAADAIGLDDFFRDLGGSKDLGFLSEREDRRVADSVVSFERVFVEGVVVGDVAVVTGGDVGVAGVFPRGVVGPHDVAVDAGFRVVGEVAGGAADMSQVDRRPGQGPDGGEAC